MSTIGFTNGPPLPWYAIQVRSRQEKRVAEMLRSKGYEEFLPLHRVARRWSDRLKEIETPLFPGYLFCRLDVQQRLPVLTTPGVITIVRSGRVLSPVDPQQIEAVHRIVKSGLRADRWSAAHIGWPVEIEDGPLAGLRGILAEVKNRHRLLVSVSLLRRTVAVEIERWRVRHLDVRKTPSGSVSWRTAPKISPARFSAA